MAQNSLPPWSFHSSQGLQGQESRAAEVRTGGLRGCLEGVGAGWDVVEESRKRYEMLANILNDGCHLLSLYHVSYRQPLQQLCWALSCPIYS